MKMLTVEEHNT